MKFFSAITASALGLASLSSAVSISPRDTASVSYDTGYDDKSRSLTAVSCSDGANGLITKYKWQTQGAIPAFPYIGGYSGIAGWNSPQCGTCWSLTYKGKTIYVLAIDHAATVSGKTGFNLAQEAMDALTGGNAVSLGRVDATAASVANSYCKI